MLICNSLSESTSLVRKTTSPVPIHRIPFSSWMNPIHCEGIPYNAHKEFTELIDDVSAKGEYASVSVSKIWMNTLVDCLVLYEIVVSNL